MNESISQLGGRIDINMMEAPFCETRRNCRDNSACLCAGQVLNLSKQWNLDSDVELAEAKSLVYQYSPLFLLGSANCGDGIVSLYHRQEEEGRFYLHDMNDGELTSRRATRAFIVADSEGKDRWITNSASLAESLEQARPSDKTEVVAAVLNGIKGQVIPTRKFGEGYNVDT